MFHQDPLFWVHSLTFCLTGLGFALAISYLATTRY